MSDICTCGQGYDPECPRESHHEPRISEASNERQYTKEERLECALRAHAECVFEIVDLRRQLAEAKARDRKLLAALKDIAKVNFNADHALTCTCQQCWTWAMATKETEGGE